MGGAVQASARSMPVEFALRPRIRLREARPQPRPHRARLRIPRFALPVAAYWLAMGGITYALVHRSGAPSESPAADESALVADPAARVDRPWWRRAPEAPSAETAPPSRAPEPAPAPVATAQAVPEPAPSPEAMALPAPREPAPFEAAPRPAADPRASLPLIERRSPNPSLTPRPTLSPDSALALHPALDDPQIDETPNPTPAPAPPRSEPHDGALPSCEAALERAHQDVDFSQGNGTADLPTAAIAAVLENGAWLAGCAVPDNTALEVCVAIHGGHVIGASVLARPANAEASGCVRRRASSLQFPYSSHVDIARTRF